MSKALIVVIFLTAFSFAHAQSINPDPPAPPAAEDKSPKSDQPSQQVAPVDPAPPVTGAAVPLQEGTPGAPGATGDAAGAASGDGDTAAAAQEEEEEEGTSEIEIPPPETPPKPVLNLPDSLPQWQDTAEKTKDTLSDATDYRALDRKVKKYSEQLYLTGYAQEKPLESVGNYLETEAQNGLPTEMQYIYVSMKPGAGEIGQHYTIVRDRGPLKKMNDATEDFHANLIQICGEIELTDRVLDKRKNVSGEVFRALITRAIDLSLKDFMLVPGKIERVSLSAEGPRASILAQLIGAQKHEASTIYAPGEVVFINKGSADGLENGQVLNIFSNRKTRNRFTTVNNAPISSGMVKVVRLGEKISTGVIVAANDGILPGDFLQNESRSEAIDPHKNPDEYDESSESDDEELDL